VLAYFIIVGLTEGIWIARIPGVKERLHLADGLLRSCWGCASRGSRSCWTGP
jgi:hypothetical protein